MFIPREFEIWQLSVIYDDSTALPKFTASEMQLHGMCLAVFASCIAPFGGFFASAIKRAYGIKDFGVLFPGHGGFTDRLDCQFIMGFCTNIHYHTFIVPRLIGVVSILATIGSMQQRDELNDIILAAKSRLAAL